MRLDQRLPDILEPHIMVRFDVMRQLVRRGGGPMADGQILVPRLQHGEVVLFEVAVVEEEGLVLVEGHGGARGVVKDLERGGGQVVDGGAVLEHGGEVGEAGAVGGHEVRGRGAGLEDFVVEEDAVVGCRARVCDVHAWFSVAGGVHFFDFVHRWLAPEG